MTTETFNLLVIDDEQDIREGCERILNRMNCHVFTAENGAAGIDIVKASDIPIVLLDLKMPGMDGMEVLQAIKEIDASALVIIITGFATIDTAIEAMKHGAYDFIPKPFDPDQLRIVVSRAMGHLRLSMQAEELKRQRERTLVDLGTEKSRIHAIIEGMPTGVVVTNFSGAVVLMNPVFKSWFQGEIDDFPQQNGENISAYINNEPLKDLILDISEGRYSGRTIPSLEVSLSNETFFLAKGQEVLGGDGACLGAVVIFNDITDLKNFDQQKSEFVAKVSHELRSPLSTIHEQIAMVAKEAGDSLDEENRYILNRAREKTGGLIALIGDLLDLSRIEAGNDFNNVSQINLKDQLNNVVDFHMSRAETKHQQLTITHQTEEIPLISADPMAIESIYGNLITNAIKYTPKKGTIKVVTWVENNAICVSIADTGYGVDEAHQKLAFQKFYRVKTDKTRHIVGTGLGLAIVQELVESMGGTIMLDSEPDKGSTFTVRLPIE